MSGRPESTLEGGCHCGAVRYSLEWPEPPAVIPARRCGCSFCTRFNGIWTSHPGARLEMRVAGDVPMSRYRFGTRTADFRFCSRCGVALLATCEIGGSTRAVLNVNTLDEDQKIEFDSSDSCFDGESLEQRLARRGRNWIGTVTGIPD